MAHIQLFEKPNQNGDVVEYETMDRQLNRVAQEIKIDMIQDAMLKTSLDDISAIRKIYPFSNERCSGCR